MNVTPRDDRWLLPDGLDEMLPPEGQRYEALRHALLQLYASWGYEVVVPPLVEYLESLLTGLGGALDLQTFKLTDLETGRTLGVRADMTPQVARIDAHQLRREGPARLCYVGTVLRTRPEGLVRTRSPLQVGAELYGHAGIEADVEVVALMLESLATAGVESVHLDLGNAAVFGALAREAELDADLEERVFSALQRKARSEVEDLVGHRGGAANAMLAELTELHGGPETLGDARARLAGAGTEVMAALDRLDALAEGLAARGAGAEVHIDLAELRGYRYHPGIVFAAFVPGHGEEVARGGRYDGIGAAFGRARPATGFSADLRTLMAVGATPTAPNGGILAPNGDDVTLRETVRALRADGERVIVRLGADDETPGRLGCDRVLEQGADGWQVVAAPATSND